MIPIIALVGRPNVGKSTLFNKLTHTNDAIVADYSGLTRDRKYGHAKWKNYNFIVIDTGGIGISKKGLAIHIIKQSLLAIKEADVIFFVVDAITGLMIEDQSIAKYLRKLQKPTFIIINKIDGIDITQVKLQFYAINIGQIFPIAALQGRGINILLKAVFLSLIQNNIPLTNNSFTESTKYIDQLLMPIKLAIVGSSNVGKSTLANSFLGEERVVVFDMPGTTRDSTYIPMIRAEREYVLIDTAGLRKRSKITDIAEKLSTVKTLQSIEESNVVLLVLDAHKGISDQDLSLLSLIIDSGRAFVIVVNKWDNLSIERRNSIKDTLAYRLSFINFARIHFISALYGTNIDQIFQSVNEAYHCSTKRISTALLTKILHIAIKEHQPPIISGYRVKLKYAHYGGYNPPIVVIHGNKATELPVSYKRYLSNFFRHSLQIMGTPIRIQFNEPANPFIHHKSIPNKLRKLLLSKRNIKIK
ncbi:ribosome biogenesis GTPase Der [Candidatus Palibaumannia cicadellinicola]|uniref:GTPase Der n=1 Tax=Baumannia cicadellinicola subsp. Homalodisca coagulata TaxID=374463 RepID=DER_BAUCH|nr:ribosome biogenesis GTPase Der [Candidatus Baumannia cicadellinicola]Q1LU74.1 RecName: Full=GTPase Der; AltName: Full=GTP-binding protein EngA [Baumannia cicadellinicola str. Hc (Homalodisca coagulata)]ABF14039.1 GTP-binding protein EngA [Baumannia cicadellinicola str. Hc (Homalodisca coagulata)]MCJ7461999.1 ribosome biogenesis GTPase Der [Candidatus Baumannia cicadellinicola]MCJ7462928.1 ribosome biogenesis GTPase Der [Candidatus Baumannia cicadellinicola]